MVKSRGSDEPVERFPFVGELEIDQDPAFEDREWRRERRGWLGIIFLLLAAAGLFGGGVLSNSEASNRGLVVAYERFIRLDTPTDLRVTIPVVQPGRQQMRVSWRPEYPVEVSSIIPEPARTEGLDNGVVYYFDAAREATAADVLIEYSIGRAGSSEIEVGSANGRVRLGQFVYP